jgi:hypothetical protein
MLTAAGASALVAGRISTQTEEFIMAESLPDLIRVEALKGFRGHVNGKFMIVNPGDVVTVSKALAVELRTANKALMTDKPERLQEHYLPERKRPAAGPSKTAQK